LKKIEKEKVKFVAIVYKRKNSLAIL